MRNLNCWCFLQNEKFDAILLVILHFSVIANGAPLPSQPFILEEVHLLRCLTYISHKYFVPGRSLVISSPSTYHDVQQELIAEIHRNSIWPVVVTVDENISKIQKIKIHRDRWKLHYITTRWEYKEIKGWN